METTKMSNCNRKETVRAALFSYRQANGHDALRDLLKRYEAIDLNTIDEADYSDLIAACGAPDKDAKLTAAKGPPDDQSRLNELSEKIFRERKKAASPTKNEPPSTVFSLF
jgi:hypothetical protein